MTPEMIATYAAAFVAALTTIVLGVKNLVGAWKEIRTALGIGQPSDLHAIVTEVHAMAKRNEEAVADVAERQGVLEDVTAGVRERVTLLEMRHELKARVDKRQA